MDITGRASSFVHGTESFGAKRKMTSFLCASYSAGKSADAPGRDSRSPRNLLAPLHASRCPRCSRSWHPPRRPLPASRVAPPPAYAGSLSAGYSSTRRHCVTVCPSVLSNAPSRTRSVVAEQHPTSGPPQAAHFHRQPPLRARRLDHVASSGSLPSMATAKHPFTRSPPSPPDRHSCIDSRQRPAAHPCLDVSL